MVTKTAVLEKVPIIEEKSEVKKPKEITLAYFEKGFQIDEELNSVELHGEEYEFTPTQIKIIKILKKQYERFLRGEIKNPAMNETTILMNLKGSKRMTDREVD